MTFIVTLITLLIERFFDWSHLRHWGWYAGYQQTVTQKLPPSPQKQPYLILAVTIIPLLILVALLQYLLKDTLYGLVEFLFQVIIVLYCLGPQSLWADAFASINALVSGDKQAVVGKLNMQVGSVEVDEVDALHLSLRNRIFIEANCRVFAALFWFVLLGPVGIVLYRTISLSAHDAMTNEDKNAISQQAHIVEAILNWAPARLMALLFALGKNFSKVFSIFCHHVLSGLEKNEVIMMECGNAAITTEAGKTAEEAASERNVLNLLDRTFVIFLILIAIFVWVI